MKRSTDYFLYTVKRVDELPEPVRVALQAQPITGDSTIIVIPPQEYGVLRMNWLRILPFTRRTTPQRTLIISDEQIVIVEMADTGLNTIVIPVPDIIYIGLGIILLYAYLELVWVENNQPHEIKIEFNSVGDSIIREQIIRLRTMLAEQQYPTASSGRTALNVRNFPFKFQGYLGHSLLRGEQLLGAVYQPALRDSHRWRRTYLSPNRVVAVTDQSVIILEDAENSPTSNYGIVTRFVPICRIQEITFEHDLSQSRMDMLLGAEDTLQTLSVPLDVHTAHILQEQCEGIPQILLHLSEAAGDGSESLTEPGNETVQWDRT